MSSDNKVWYCARDKDKSMTKLTLHCMQHERLKGGTVTIAHDVN